jgi:hypothetical protein
MFIPEVNGWADHEIVIKLQSVASIIARNQEFMQLFARSNAYDLMLAVRADGFGKIHEPH